MSRRTAIPYVSHLQYAIVDFTEATSLVLKQDKVIAVAAFDRQRSLEQTPPLITIVAPQDYIFGISRMWESYTGPSVRSFISPRRVDAVDWLKQNGVTVPVTT